MKCVNCNMPPPEAAWKSKSQINGVLGQKSPILKDELQTFPVYMNQPKKVIEHPLSFVTKEVCTKCNRCILKAFESIYYKDEIIFELISSDELKLKNNKASIDMNLTYQRSTVLRKATLNPTVRPINTSIFGNRRDRYNFHNEPQEIKDAVFELVKNLFVEATGLSESQANVITKLKLGRKLRKSTERNVKKQLKSKLRKMQNLVWFWEDLEGLIDDN